MNHGNSGFNQWIRKVWIERNDLPRRQHALIDDCPRRHTRNIEKISARQSCVTNGVFRAAPDHVKLPLKRLLVGYPFAATNKNLAHKWLAQFRRVAEVKIVSGHLAPAQQFLPLAGDNFRQDLFELPALFSLIRQEDQSHAVLAWVWQMKPEPFTGVLKKGMRNLHQNTRTVAGILFATAGPPMIEVLQNGQRLIDDLVGFFTLNVDDRTDGRLALAVSSNGNAYRESCPTSTRKILKFPFSLPRRISCQTRVQFQRLTFFSRREYDLRHGPRNTFDGTNLT